MKNFTEKEKKEIRKYRKHFPRSIEVEVSVTQDGKLIADVKDYPGCYTQANNLHELIDMVNDAIYTMFEIPQKYYSEMPSYTPPISLAQALNVFPKKKDEIESPVKFQIEINEGTK